MRTREEIKARQAAWHQANKARLNARSLDRYYANREAASIQRKARYKQNATTVKAQMAAKRTERRAFVNAFKEVPCKDCGNRFPTVCMDFDHLGDKEECVSILLSHNAPLKKIEAEIKKCEVVCSNCHRIRTARRQGKVL